METLIVSTAAQTIAERKKATDFIGGFFYRLTFEAKLETYFNER